MLGILDEVCGLLSAATARRQRDARGTVLLGPAGLDPQLTVVTGLPRPDRWTEVRAGTVELLVEIARRHGHVVVDTGFSIEQTTTSAAAPAATR